MKIIKQKIVLFFVATVALLTACSEDLLDQKNPNSPPVTEFWKSEADAQYGLNAAFAMFYKTGSWSRWIYFRYDLTSDEGYSKSPWVELADWTRFQYINYNFWEGNNNLWRDHYKAVFRCNQVLANVPAIEFDANRKAQLLAQAKFLRAFYYFNMAILWEDVPVILDPSEPEDLPKQNTVAEVWAQVEKDLQEAAADLPEQWSDGELGKPTKGAAFALLGKTHMQQREWKEAIAAFEYLVNGAGKGYYGLMPEFRDNFTDRFENNRESVFEIQFSKANTGADGDEPNASMGNTRSQFFAPSSIGWSDGQARYWLVDAFKKEPTKDGEIDQRLRYTLFYSDLEKDFGDKVYGRSWQWGNEEAWFRKYQRDYERVNEDYYSQVNTRVIRYADVLLLYAEALNEDKQTASAYQYVNMVRERSNLEALEIAHPEIGTDQNKFKERVKIERALELCGESVRWMDLKRWGDLDTEASVDIIAQRDPDFNNFVVGKHRRLPLPQIEVENNANLTQSSPY